jgi:DNA polymerase-3 subunit gamma/tau
VKTAENHPAVAPAPGKPAVNPDAMSAQTTAKEPQPRAVPGSYLTGSPAERLKLEWRRILEQVPPDLRKSPALAILRSAGVQPVGFDKGIVVLSFRYGYLKEKLEEMENQRVAEKVLSGFIGQACKVQCVLENNNLVKEALKMGAEIIDVEET